MNWLLEHFQIIVAVAGAVAYWLNQRSEARKNRDAGREVDPSPLQGPVDGEDESATRRIQDEIRRKIAERRGDQGPPPLPTSRPVHADIPPPSPTMAPRPVAREISGEMRRIWDARLAEASLREEKFARDRARRLAEQAEAEQAEREARARVEAIARLKAAAEAGAAANTQRQAFDNYVSGLRGQGNLRRAIVLREILGPPVALRPAYGDRAEA